MDLAHFIRIIIQQRHNVVRVTRFDPQLFGDLPLHTGAIGGLVEGKQSFVVIIHMTADADGALGHEPLFSRFFSADVMKESIVMSNRRWFSVLAGAPVIGCLLVLPTTAMAANETHVYGIANFGHSGECEDDTDLSHSVHTSTAAAFAANFSVLKLLGLWDEVSTRNNTSARGSYWTDASKSASCMCSCRSWYSR